MTPRLAEPERGFALPADIRLPLRTAVPARVSHKAVMTGAALFPMASNWQPSSLSDYPL